MTKLEQSKVTINPLKNCEFPHCDQNQQTFFQRDDGMIFRVCLNHRGCLTIWEESQNENR